MTLNQEECIIYSATICTVDKYSTIIYAVNDFIYIAKQKMDIKKAFWEKVRRLRKQLWYSQEEFAQKCWIHRTYMGLIERWKTNITLENIEKIAKHLGIQAKDLV